MSILDTVGATFAKLGDKAASATLSRTTPGAYDPATGAPAEGTTSTCSTKAVLDAAALQTLGFKFGEDLVQGGDIRADIPAKGLTFEPAPGDTLTLSGWPYAVIAVRPTFVGSTAVLYQLLVRK